MAATPAPIGGTFAKTDEVKRLQAQVDQMKERLDFISPMLPLVNFVQDYFQRVECEASVQLMRLKNAQVMADKDITGEDDNVNAQLETVKWLHFMTDAIMSIHNGPALQPPTPSSSPQPHALDLLTGPAAAALRGYPRVGDTQGLANAFPSLERRVNASPQAPMGSPGMAMTSPAARQVGDGGWNEYSDTPTRQPSGGNVGRDRAGMMNVPQGSMRSTPDELVRSRGDSLLASMTPGVSSAPFGSLGLAAAAAAKASGGGSFQKSYDLPGASTCATEEPLAEPGTGGTNERFQMDSSMSGVMGRGSWATAYRQASGNRKEALRLLCSSGIVTARELSDDLTVISDDHIEECVQIATEMLQTWTLEMWARQPQEAKKFFEARLTALYQRKFGEQNLKVP